MKKYYKSPKKNIRELDTGKSHSGEASPYWNFLNASQRTDAEGKPEENVFSNPDLMSEDDHLYYRPLSETGELQLQVIREVFKDLSPRQQRVLYLCGQLGKTQEETAKELSISRQAVNETLQRVRKRIQICYKVNLAAKKI